MDTSPVLDKQPKYFKPLNLRQMVNGEDGYSIELKLIEPELDLMHKMIRIQWLYRLQMLIPKQVHQFDEVGMGRYHELSHLIDHAKAWPKYSRVLPKEAVLIIKEMSFFQILKEEFGDIVIADEERLGWENIYWRLVRPGQSDIGSVHSDRWFVKLGYYGDEINDHDYERVKIWISLNATPGKNGLMVVPSSHRKFDWKWHAEERYGQKKPVIDEDITKLNLVLLPTEPGRMVVFHYDLLHGGAPNLANTTRLSMEFTFLVRNH